MFGADVGQTEGKMSNGVHVELVGIVGKGCILVFLGLAIVGI